MKEGARIGDECKDIFTWLTATNKGAANVCMAALGNIGITEDDLLHGYPCDPQSKSMLNILARPGIVLRLTRNLDKMRGFVNGAVCIVVEPLRGNSIFTAKLLSSGNFVLVHPLTEDGNTFLPCCYGYATTIRRAQGASLTCGAVYFDQHKHAAPRGYGYVAVSRFRTQARCHLYGKLRATDFLPVGPEQEDEQLYRGVESGSDSESDYRSSNDSDNEVSWNIPSDDDASESDQRSYCEEDAEDVSESDDCTSSDSHGQDSDGRVSWNAASSQDCDERDGGSVLRRRRNDCDESE